MNTELQEILNNSIVALLKQHACVIVPGLGAFLTADKSAHIDAQQQLIFPSGKNTSFNAQLQHNDGLLIHYVAQQQQITFLEAEQFVKNQVQLIKDSLKHGNTIRWNNVGKLKLNEYNNLIFIPLSHNTLSLNSYGLKAVTLPEKKKIVANEAVVTDLVEESKTLKKSVNKRIKSNKAWYATAVIAVAFLAVSQIIYFNAKNESIAFQQLSIASIFDAAVKNKKNETQINSFSIPEKKLISIPQNFIIEPAIQEHITSVSNQEIEKGYYAIIGSFKNFDNAQKTLVQLNSNQSKTQIIPTEEGNYRVGIFISDKISEVRKDIKTYRARYNKQAWIMYNQ